MRSRRASSFVGLLLDRLRHAGFGDLLAVLLGDRGAVLAQLALDRLHLLAQDVLALLLVRAGLDVLADLLAQLQLGQALALEVDDDLQAVGDVERLERADLVLEGHVGRVADRVGQRAGIADRAQERADAVVGAAQLEDLLDDRAVLALEVAGAARRPARRRRARSTSTMRRPAASVWAAPATPRATPESGDGAAAAGEADVVGDLGDRADLRELALVARDEQDPLLVANADGKRHIHGGEDHRVVQRDEQERCHGVWLHFL